MPADDPRVVVPVRLRSSAVAAVDAIATEHDWSRSEAMRHLFRLGLAAYRQGALLNVRVDDGRQPTARPAPKPSTR